MDYIKLGQSATTLSGGEAQRVKLALELNKRSTGKTLYILDEPSTGLHFYDIDKLLIMLKQLADTGNTVLIIEHNMDIIKSADWIIDLGKMNGKSYVVPIAQIFRCDCAIRQAHHHLSNRNSTSFYDICFCCFMLWMCYFINKISII